MGRMWRCLFGSEAEGGGHLVPITQKRACTFAPVQPDLAQSLVQKFATVDSMQAWVSQHDTAYACGETVLIRAPGVMPTTPMEELVSCKKCYQSGFLTTHCVRKAWNDANRKASIPSAPAAAAEPENAALNIRSKVTLPPNIFR